MLGGVRLRFLHRLDDPDLLNLCLRVRQRPCPHCQSTGSIIRHSYSKGYRPDGRQRETRRLRFFCSNRRNRPGCGGTFSLLWSDLITRSGIAAALLDLIAGVADGRSLHGVWHDGAFPFSVTTAYRWLRRWHRQQPHLRTHLARDHPPPRGDHLPSASRTLRHLRLAFPRASCPVAAFQHAHQVDFLP
jgi:hypothetical protein